jgi:YggT family protein
LRVILQYLRAPFQNPLCQFIVKTTNPGFFIFRKIIPGYGGVDIAGVFFAYTVALLKTLIIDLIRFGTFTFVPSIFFTPVIVLISTILTIYFCAIILQAVFSFIAMNNYAVYNNPIYSLCSQIVDPVLRPLRKNIPTIAGFDLSPLVALLIITIIRIIFNIY